MVCAWRFRWRWSSVPMDSSPWSGLPLSLAPGWSLRGCQHWWSSSRFWKSFFPNPEEEPITPAFRDGEWEIAENGKLVQFFVETSGFKRGDIWLPAGKLRFRANAYGQLLSAGRDASVTIRESRSVFGLFAGLFAGITLGPVAFLASGLVSAWQLREVAVCVGRCSISRLPDEAESLQMSSVRITADDPDKWK
mmetsp:Transcript_90181/g.291516  ORF Transcript_90181/g.291516 Transcript_90181/m.291516 type:complete len:193 (+) Transcript_90181:375-953(+)